MLFWLSETGKIWGFQAFWSCSVDFPHYGDPLADIGHMWGFWRTCGSKCRGEGGGIFPTLCVECCLVTTALSPSVCTVLTKDFLEWHYSIGQVLYKIIIFAVNKIRTENTFWKKITCLFKGTIPLFLIPVSMKCQQARYWLQWGWFSAQQYPGIALKSLMLKQIDFFSKTIQQLSF